MFSLSTISSLGFQKKKKKKKKKEEEKKEEKKDRVVAQFLI